MKVIIIEPFLKNFSGHQFNYTIQIKSQLDKMKIKSFILGHISADKECLKIENFFPCLSDITGKIFDSKSVIDILQALKSIILLKKQFIANILKNLYFKLEKGDILFTHSLYIFELLSLSWFLRQYRKVFQYHNCKIIIGFNYEYRRNSIILTLILSLLYKFSCDFLLKKFGSELVFFSDGELLKKDYDKLLNRELFCFPVPILPFSVPTNSSYKSDTNKIVISYLGATRYNKGFDIFVKMLKELIKDKTLKEKVYFIIQVNVQKQFLSELKVIQNFMSELTELMSSFPNIEIFYKTLEFNKYYELLNRSDIVVLPYRKESFKSCPSNIFRETIIANKIPIVPEGTSMAYELSQWNLNDLVFKSENIDDLLRTIKNVIQNYTDYKKRIEGLQKKLEKYHTAANLVNYILTI